MLIFLLVLATIMIDLVAISLENGKMVVMALGFSQIGLLTAWLVWGHWNFVARLAVFLGAIVAWSHPLSQWNNRPPIEWMGTLLVFAMLVLIPLAALRAHGYYLTSPVATTVRKASSRRRLQFSLWNILCLMTGLAFVLSFGRQLVFPWEYALEIALLCGSFALVVVVILVSGLRSRRIGFLIVLSAIVSFMASRLLASWGGTANYFLILSSVAALIGLSITVVRVSEYRLTTQGDLS